MLIKREKFWFTCEKPCFFASPLPWILRNSLFFNFDFEGTWMCFWFGGVWNDWLELFITSDSYSKSESEPSITIPSTNFPSQQDSTRIESLPRNVSGLDEESQTLADVQQQGVLWPWIQWSCLHQVVW